MSPIFNMMNMEIYFTITFLALIIISFQYCFTPYFIFKSIGSSTLTSSIPTRIIRPNTSFTHTFYRTKSLFFIFILKCLSTIFAYFAFVFNTFPHGIKRTNSLFQMFCQIFIETFSRTIFAISAFKIDDFFSTYLANRNSNTTMKIWFQFISKNFPIAITRTIFSMCTWRSIKLFPTRLANVCHSIFIIRN